MGKYGTGAPYIFQSGETSIKPQYAKPGFVPAYRFLVTQEDYDEAMSDLDTVTMVSFDTETTSLYIDELTLVSFSFAYGAKNWVVLVNHEDETMSFTDEPKLHALVLKILTREVPFLFNARFDLRVAEKELGVSSCGISPVDVQSLVFIVDSNWKMPGLKEVEKFFLGYEPPDFDNEWRGNALQHVDPQKLGLYSAYDSYGTLKVGELFYREVMNRYGFILKLDRKLIPALMYFEEAEFNVDRKQLIDVQESLKIRASDLQVMIADSVGPFLITSSQQLGKKLKELGYHTGVETKTGLMSVSIDALLNIEDAEFVKWVIEFKKLMKLDTAYIQPMLRRMDIGLPFRFHYILNNAPTMRLAAGAYAKSKKKSEQQMHHFVDLNFQSISKPSAVNRRVDWNPDTLEIRFHDEGKYLVETGKPTLNLRKAFFPPSDEFTYCSIDFAGQELRIAACLSGEKIWQDAFLSGGDVHKNTAVAIWGAENYDKNKRKKAKIANFGVLYGGGTFFLKTKLKMTEQEAADFIREYRAALPDLFRWTDQVHLTARRQGYIISPYQLPRRLSFFYRQGGMMAGFADRSAVNTLIQGSAGVIIRIALTRLYDLIRPGGRFHGDILFRGTIHDELDFCIRKSRFKEVIETIVPLMTNTIPKSWPVPMDVEVSVGNNWGEMFAVDHTVPGFPPKEVEVFEAKTDDPADYAVADEEYFDEDDEELAGAWA